MAELKTQLDLQQIPKIVGEDGTQLLARCYAVLEHTRWPLYIVGPSGSGKSIIAMNLARQYALAKNVPAYYVQLSPEQTKTSLILGLRLENGSLAVKNGVVADCMERGGIIIVDEATHSVQEILLMFNSILDRTSVTAIGDKMIYAHEDFRIVFCSNDSRYSGNVKLPQSFAQRLVSFYFDYPTAEDELLIVEQIVAEECRANDVVPVSLKRYIIELMREVRSNTYPLSVRNAAIAVVLCNLELLRRPEWRQTMIDSYFYDNRNVESIKRYLAKRVLGCEAASVTDLTDRRIMELEQALSAIGIGTFKEIIELKAKMQNAASQTGKLAGVGRMVSRSGDTSQFFLDTVRKYRREIGELEYIFKQSFTSMKIIGAYDGDVNLKKQQEAYLASKTAEESRVYQYYLRRKVSVDIMIIRDVSGSTYRFEREYAEALIEILAAVNNFDGIRTLVIDFEGGAKVRKSFIDKAEQTSIVPLSGGGTNLLPAVRLLQEQVLKGKRRLLFLLSDGEINDREQAERELNDYCRRNQIEMVKITFDEEDKYGYEHTTIINLHRFLARRIIEKGAAY